MKLAAIPGALLAALLLLTGCSEVNAPSGGEFEPAREGILSVATDLLPQPGFWEGKPEPHGGFEWGLAQEFAERFGLERVKVIERPFEQLVSGDLGGADLAMAQITPTAERDEVLDFSEPYLSGNPAVLVRDDLTVRDVFEARGLSWAVQAGTTLESELDSRIVPDAEVLRPKNQSAVVAAVRQGKVEAALLDLPVALAYTRDDERLSVAAQISSDEALAVAMPQDSPNREAVSSAIRAMISEGVIDQLAERWLDTDLRGNAFTVEEVPLLRTK